MYTFVFVFLKLFRDVTRCSFFSVTRIDSIPQSQIDKLKLQRNRAGKCEDRRGKEIVMVKL